MEPENLQSADQLIELARFVFPLFRIRQRGLASGNGLPGRELGQLVVERDHVQLVGRHIFFGVDGANRALGHADGAVDAFVGINCQEIGAFTETVHRANVHAIGVFATDAGFGYYVSHGENLPNQKNENGQNE